MYVAVKGGEKAIDAAHALQESRRRGDTDLPELSVAQIEQQLNLAVDRVRGWRSLKKIAAHSRMTSPTRRRFTPAHVLPVCSS